LRFVEKRLFGSTRGRRHVQVSTADTRAFGRLLDALDEHADRVREVGSTRSDTGAIHVDLDVRGRSGEEVAALLAELDALEGVDVSSTGPDVD
jgi:hypothetical protein